MDRSRTAVPVAFDALRPVTTVGAVFYLVFAVLVHRSFRSEISLAVPAVVATAGLLLVALRVALSSRLEPLLRRHALTVAATLAVLFASITVVFMAVWQRPYPGVGLILIMIATASLIHHRTVAILILGACNAAWMWAALRFGVPIPWGVFVTELVMVDVAAMILHLASTRTVRRLEEARHEILELAGTDDLTGVANSRRIHDEGRRRLERAVAAGQPVAVLYLDMDDLKAHNDAGGHRAGDRALQRLTEAIRGAVRPTDLVGRIGGDEFVVIASVDTPEAETLATRVRESLAAVDLSASIGIASTSSDLDFENLLHRADQAMYAVKDRRADLRPPTRDSTRRDR